MGNSSSGACPGLLQMVLGVHVSPPGTQLPSVVGNTFAQSYPLKPRNIEMLQDGSATSGKAADRRIGVSSTIVCRVLFGIIILCITAISGFFMDWLDEDDTDGFSWLSVFKFGSIPIIAAIIGFGTNVVALWMMFWPLEFHGCLPQCKLGPPLDFFLFGYQGVIPMKVKEMAELSYEMMTTKLITVPEMFERIDPDLMHQELQKVMPQTISVVLNEAAEKSIPEWWKKTPAWMKKSLEERTTAAMGPLLSVFIEDMKTQIEDVFDLRHAVVELMINNKKMTNDLFHDCGADELRFIKISGFYLGYVFGVVQMLLWLFLRRWWILPICGVVVGYLTNAFALKVIFMPVNPRPICGGLYTVQGLFLKRQQEVSVIYAEKVSREILSIDNLIHEMCYGAKSESLHRLVDNHVMQCLQQQIGNFKKLLVWSIGPEELFNFEVAACEEFWKQFPKILSSADGYMETAMNLEPTLTERMQNMRPGDFERLLHSVFEQDEFKLILVGAILGAIVGFIQALVQEPAQLGIS